MPLEINKAYEKLLFSIENGSITQINAAFRKMIFDLSLIISRQTIQDPRINRNLQRQIVEIKRAFVNHYNKILSTYEGTAIDLSVRKNLKEISAAITGLEIETGLVKTWLGRPNKPNVKIVSGRVWHINKGFYQNLDNLLKSGLLEGLPAHEVKLQLTRLLNRPESLDLNELRRRGILRAGGEESYRKLEQEILSYRPGAGYYKSSKKNAFRLSRNEINRAYRQQDNVVRKNLNFIVGIEVKLSDNHDVIDICDDMIGRYAKDYIFLGYHPACRCYAVPILATKEQTAKLIANKPVKLNPVKGIPKRAENYIKKRKKNINKYKTTPYFIQENNKYYKDLLK